MTAPGHRIQVPENSSSESDRPEPQVLADALKKAGYATGAAGKWHLGMHSRGAPRKAPAKK